MTDREISDAKRRAYAAALAELRVAPTRYAWARALRMRRDLLGTAPVAREPSPVAPFPVA